MREQHAELMMQLEALEPGADGAGDEEFTERELEVLAMLPSPLTTRWLGSAGAAGLVVNCHALVSVSPAKTSPAPTNADKPIQ